MKLGLMTAALPDLSLEEIAIWAGQSGFETLEIACWPQSKATRRYAGVTHIDVETLDDMRAAAVRELMARHQLQISSLAYYPNPLHADESHRAMVIGHLKRVIVAASKLGVEVVGTFAGRDQTLPMEANLERFAQIWPEIVHFAGDHNVAIAIENCPMLFSGDEWPGGQNLAISPHVWRRLFEIIPDQNFGLNLDPSHLIWQFIDAERVVREFKDRLLHVHAKDLEINREGLFQHGILSLGMGWQTPRLPGLGEVNWPRFIAALYSVGYDKFISIEHEDRAFEGEEGLVKRGFYIARDVLRPLIH